MKTEILYLNKSPYENGKLSGKYFRDKVEINLETFESLLKDNNIKNKITALFNKLKQEYPIYYDETIGKADWLGIDRLIFFSIRCPEITDTNFEHCTTIMCKKDNGKFIISHNEDWEYIKWDFCLSKVKIDDNNRFVTNDMYEMPFWNWISRNSYGIVKTINYCHDDNLNIDNLPRYFAQRHLTEAKSIEDLIKRCEEMKVASGFHVNAIDINKNIAVSVEVYSNGIDVEYIDDYYIHSNHFIHKDHLNNPETDEWSNSILRLNKCRELFGERTMEWIQKILSYRSEENKFESSIFQVADDPYITSFNFSYDLDDKNFLYLNNYVDNEILKLNYDL